MVANPPHPAHRDSEDHINGDPGDAAFVLGRRAPFSQVPDWVALADIPGAAMALYWHMRMHVNATRGDDEAWPLRETLADMQGFSRPASVDKYVKDLQRIGAIDVKRIRTHGGMRKRNLYIVHEMPPPGHQGPITLAEYYDRRGQEAKPQVSPEGRGSVPPKREGKTAGQPGRTRKRTSARAPEGRSGVPPEGRQGISPEGRQSVLELDEVELDELELDELPPPPSPRESLPGESAAAPAVTPTREGEGDGRETSAQKVAREILDALPDEGWEIGPKDRRQLMPLVVAALDGTYGGGPYPKAKLLRKMTANRDGAKFPGAALRARLENLPRLAAPKESRRRKCAQGCTNGWHLDDQDRPKDKCQCHAGYQPTHPSSKEMNPTP